MTPPSTRNQYADEDAEQVAQSREALLNYSRMLGVTHSELAEHVNDVRARNAAEHVTAVKLRARSRQIAGNMMEFLAHYRETSLLTDAAESISVTMRTIRAWAADYQMFAAMLGELDSEVVDRARDELYRRAVIGTATPIIYQGEVVEDTYIKKSDDLLKFFIVGNSPQYGKTVPGSAAAQGKNESPVNILSLRDRLVSRMLAKSTELGNDKPAPTKTKVKK